MNSNEPRKIFESRKRIFEYRERTSEPSKRIFKPRRRIFEPRKRMSENDRVYCPYGRSDWSISYGLLLQLWVIVMGYCYKVLQSLV